MATTVRRFSHDAGYLAVLYPLVGLGQYRGAMDADVKNKPCVLTAQAVMWTWSGTRLVVEGDTVRASNEWFDPTVLDRFHFLGQMLHVV